MGAIERAADAVLASWEGNANCEQMPEQAEVAFLVAQSLALLFPQYYGVKRNRAQLLTKLNAVRTVLVKQLERAYCARGAAGSEQLAVQAADTYLDGLSAVRTLAMADANTAFISDPAAASIDEVIVCYPGFAAITVYRLAHALAQTGAPLVPRMMTELAHQRTGIDIHPGARIGSPFFIDHGTGVVIGETTVIGDRVRIYQGVTLGALSIPVSEARPAPGSQRHPTIEADVVIYANATILGGDTVIGAGSVIGGNSWVTSSVPPGTTIAGAASRGR